MELKGRFAEAFEHFKINRKEFAEYSGISQQYISSLISGKDPVGLKPIKNLLKYEPRLNARWLITGEGEISIRDFTSAVQEDKAEYQTNTKYQKSLEKINELYEKIEALREENRQLRDELEEIKGCDGQKRRTG